MTVESVLKSSPTIDQFLDRHSRKRHYMFQIKKCLRDDCAYCVLSPPRLPVEEFQELHFIPDPMLNEQGDYKAFDEVYGTDTDDSARPSLKDDAKPTERDKKFKSILVATKVRSFVLCMECGKRRVVFSRKKLARAEEDALMRVDEELMYVCGNTLFPPGKFEDDIIVKEGHTCSSPIEASYYAGQTQSFDDICFHCGDTETVESEEIRRLKEEFGIVRPICQTCVAAGKPVKTRNALKIKKRK